MATIKKEFTLDADAAHVWDALRDFGAVHERIAPGFVVRTELESDARIVTFANGSVARKELVAMDDADRRLVYRIRNERLQHHNASAQAIADGPRCRFVWITDVLPDAIAPYIDSQMTAGVGAIKKAFGS